MTLNTSLQEYATFLRKLWIVVTRIPQLYFGAGRTRAATLVQESNDSEPDVDIPEEFKDPISYAAMQDPVVLVATGQVYEYEHLREWFAMGNRVCPLTNRPVNDAHISRLLALKQRINSWRAENGLPIAPHESYDEFAELDEKIPSLVRDLKSGGAANVQQALMGLNRMMCAWERGKDKATTETKEMQAKLRECIMEDLILAIRYGSTFVQGVAAGVLGFSETESELGWLRACASVPLCSLLFSPNQYANQAAARLIMNLSRGNANGREVFRQRGIVDGLLKQVQKSDKFPYSRSMAASCLSGLASVASCRDEILEKGGLQLLLEVLAEANSRHEQCECSMALLVLGVTQEDLMPYDFTLRDLFKNSYSSAAWLKGEVESPQEGVTSADRARIKSIHRSVNRRADMDMEEWAWLGLDEEEGEVLGEEDPILEEELEEMLEEADIQGEEGEPQPREDDEAGDQ